MQRYDRKLRRGLAALAAALAAAGCDSDLSGIAEEAPLDRVAVVANRGDRTLTLIPFADTLGGRTVQLGGAGEPAGIAVRGDRALVPMGAPGVAMVNLRTGMVDRTVALPGGAAGGAAFVGDTLVAATSPGQGAVFFFNPARAAAPRAVATGGSPAAVYDAEGRVFVLSATRPGGSPNGALMVVDTAGGAPLVVELGAPNPRALLVYGGQVYVLNAGDPGRANGSVSVVNPALRREVQLIRGFGESPESMVFTSRGELYVVVPGRGVVVYDLARGFVRSADAPIASGSASAGMPPASRVAMDPAGFTYTLHRGSCTAPGLLVRLDANGDPASSARTGICPVGVEFTSLPRR